jgi:hypothetical protein
LEPDYGVRRVFGGEALRHGTLDPFRKAAGYREAALLQRDSPASPS